MEAKYIEIIEQLTKINEELRRQLSDALLRLELAEAEIRVLKSKQFGSKSEKSIIEDSPNLFNEVEETADESVTEPTYETITYTRPKKKRSKEELLKDLPVETIEYTLSEEERLCPYGHGSLSVIGKEVTREIAIIPAQTYVIEHVVYKYGCNPCEVHGNEDNKTVIIAANKPNRLIPGSMASASAISYIIDQKYTYGMPLYRISQHLERNGVNLSRQTMSNWVVKGSESLVVLYDRLK